MGKVPKPHIVFQKKHPVFYPGDVIEGEIILNVDAEGLEKIQGVWVKLKGKAKCEFKRGKMYFEETEHYFNSRIVVFGTDKGQPSQPNLTLPPGRNAFPFTFQIPADRLFPSPFGGPFKTGYVRYWATATLSVLRKLINKKNRTEENFAVRGPTVDLNSIPGLEQPMNCQAKVRDVGGQGTAITFSVPRQGYVSGESITVNGRVVNRAGMERRNVKATLVQETTYRAQTRSTTENKTLSRKDASVVCPRGKATDFTVGELQIPRGLPPSGLPGCSIMDVQYYVKCKSPGYTKTKLPVTIGTVALGAPARVPAPTAAEALPPTAPSERDDLPTYEEAMKM